MAENESLGFVETIGLVTAIETADAMVKAARVRVKTVANADAGLISVICTGDLAACMAAVDAGKAAAMRVGQVVSTNLIPRPDDDTETLVASGIGSIMKAKPASRPPAEDKAPAKGDKGRK